MLNFETSNHDCRFLIFVLVFYWIVIVSHYWFPNWLLPVTCTGTVNTWMDDHPGIRLLCC